MKTIQNYKNAKTVSEELNKYFMVGAAHPDEFIIVGMPDENDPDGYFSRYGCTVLNNGLGTTVYDVEIITAYYDTKGRYVETARHSESVCYEVLAAYHNGEDIPIDADRCPITE